MFRLLLIAAALPFLSGCISNPGNYYSYEGGGDYYYEDAGADVFIDSFGAGYGGGFGIGTGYGGYGYGGYGLGYGYGGFGFGGYYGGYGYPWGYGYSPIWSKPPTVIVVDSPSWRPRGEAERAERVRLSHRPDAAYPESATWARRNGLTPGGNRAAMPDTGARRVRSTMSAPAASRPAVSSSRRSPASSQTVSPPPSPSRSSSSSRPMRSAPSQRGSSRKH
ncbi:hypothetical protein [Dokdonella sp.]|uniref:hypothetical protein n=1 Tax=Dokdonella sp. TaxID=2291710 RepID=UPI003C53B6D9